MASSERPGACCAGSGAGGTPDGGKESADVMSPNCLPRSRAGVRADDSGVNEKLRRPLIET